MLAFQQLSAGLIQYLSVLQKKSSVLAYHNHDVASEGDITSCNIINKPLASGLQIFGKRYAIHYYIG